MTLKKQEGIVVTWLRYGIKTRGKSIFLKINLTKITFHFYGIQGSN